MLKLERKYYWIVGLSIAVISFILFFIGVRVVCDNEVTIGNLVAYGVFGATAGFIASLLVFFRLKLAFIAYILGWIVGYFEMYRSFINGMSGWGDLIGVISLFTWMAIGLGIGILSEIGRYVYMKSKKN